MKTSNNVTKIVPESKIQAGTNDDEKGEHVIAVEKLLSSYAKHEKVLEEANSLRRARQKRQTQMRIRARARVRSTNALANVPLFRGLTSENMTLLIEAMEYEKYEAGATLVKEGEEASKFFIITQGSCVVTSIHKKPIMKKTVLQTMPKPNLAGKLGLGFAKIKSMHPNQKESLLSKWHAAATAEVQIGKLNALDFFGESALLVSSEEKIRKATVRASLAGPVQVLSLSHTKFEELVSSHVFGSNIVDTVKQTAKFRRRQTAEILLAEAEPDSDTSAKDQPANSATCKSEIEDSEDSKVSERKDDTNDDNELGRKLTETPLRQMDNDEESEAEKVNDESVIEEKRKNESTVGDATDEDHACPQLSEAPTELSPEELYERKRREALLGSEGGSGSWL